VSDKLEMQLATTNVGDAPFQIGEALHTYFHISDIGSVKVSGLEGATFHDKVDHFATKKQSGAIGFSGEVDRVYVNTHADCVIEDAGLKRRIRIAKTGSLSTIVWTPWTEKAVIVSRRTLTLSLSIACLALVRCAPVLWSLEK